MKIGDKVKITDRGKRYSTYDEWFYENDIPLEYAVKFQYDSEFDNNDLEREFVILEKAPHGIYNNTMLYLIGAYSTTHKLIKTLLFSEDGIELLASCFAVAQAKAELEKFLGCRVEITN